jgi:3'-phosphoadenosine 5'-phosphosulfate sulfotransferase (PAPS reductase)/FAD synthetase
VSDPFRLPTPFVVSFSGGRTSGYMLRRVLDAFGGTLPDGGKVIFCNTGKERPETLDFVQECSARWSVPIIWLEHVSSRRTGIRRVNHATAARNGEPFAALIRWKQRLPNVAERWCTEWLKLLTMHRYVTRTCGWLDYTDCVGLRADEPGRFAKLAAGSDDERTPGREPAAPLYRAGVTIADVMAFWKAQPFDLALEPDEGNCDQCFLKGRDKAAAIMRKWPESPNWWDQQEQWVQAKTGQPRASFRKGLPMADFVRQVEAGREFADEPTFAACHCTD